MKKLIKMTTNIILTDIDYYDDGFRPDGFYSSDEVGTFLIRTMARNLPKDRITKERLKTLYNKPNQNFKLALLFNCAKILGYIPVLGVIPGVVNLVAFTKQQNEGAAYGYFARAISEIGGYGILNIPVDIFVTYKRRQNPISFAQVIEAVPN